MSLWGIVSPNCSVLMFASLVVVTPRKMSPCLSSYVMHGRIGLSLLPSTQPDDTWQCFSWVTRDKFVLLFRNVQLRGIEKTGGFARGITKKR